LDANKFVAMWNRLYPDSLEFVEGVGEEGQHYAHIEVLQTSLKRESAVVSVLGEYKKECSGDFAVVGDILPGGKHHISAAIKAAKENCTAWAWTPAVGLVGHRPILQSENTQVFLETIARMEGEIETIHATNKVLHDVKDREIARLKAEVQGDESADQDGAGLLRAKLTRVRAEREKLKADVVTKDKELSTAKEAAADGLRARAMDTYWRAENERLNLEVERLKSARADCVVARGESERMRAQVERIERSAMEFVQHDAKDVGKIKNLREAYVILAMKAGQYQATGADERVHALRAEVRALQTVVEAGKHAAEAKTVAYCGELERQNQMLVESRMDTEADDTMAVLRKQVDEGKVMEAALRAEVKDAEARIVMLKSEVDERMTRAERMEQQAREVFQASGGRKQNGLVHAELAARYNGPKVTRAETAEWINLHNDPLFRLGMDYGGVFLKDMELDKKRAEAATAAMSLERSRALNMHHDVRVRCDKAERAEAKARRLLVAYAGERADLVVKRAAPAWEAQAHAIVQAVREATVVFAALEGEVRSLVEKREWCEVLSSKCGSLATEFRRRAQRMAVADTEREFLMRCVPDLEKAIAK
jgi:hypothetical protein